MQSSSAEFPRKHFAVVAALAALIRLGLFLVYGPVAYSDTPSYRRLAEAILHGFKSYDGTRTPGYPAFLALVGSDQRVYITQLLLGLLITLLLFWMMWRLTGNPWLSSAAALLHTLNLGQLFFEANLLTETLTTFWLVLCLAGMLLLLSRHKPSLWLAVGIGLAAALAAITRPLFIYMPFWLLLFALWHAAGSSTSKRVSYWLKSLFTPRLLATLFAVLIPAVLILGGWVFYIHARYHMWSLSTMTGYHMIQHTGNFFEYLPDDQAALRDTYLRYRVAHVAEYGTQTNTIWEAIPEMQKVSGLTFYDLSRKLSTLSIWLITHKPALFARSVLEGWWLFWRAPFYWQAEAFNLSFLTKITPPLVLLERGTLVLTNLIFVLASIPALFIKRLQPSELSQRAFIACLVGTIWLGSIVQTLLDHGDNPRFLVPMQSLVVFWLLWFAHRLWLAFRKKA